MTLHFRQPHHDIEAAVALEHLTGDGAAQCNRHSLLHVVDRQAIARERFQVRCDRHQWQARHLFDRHIRRPGNVLGQCLDLRTKPGQFIHVVAEYLDGHLCTYAGEQLVHAHLYWLQELIVAARDRADSFIQLSNQSRLRFARIGPVTTIFEHDEGIGHRRRHGVSGDLRGTDLGDHFRHLGKRFECVFKLALHADRLSQTGTGNAQGVQGDVALVQVRDELGAQARR